MIERPSRLPLAPAVVAGVVVLVGVLWGAFELGRRQPGPVTAAAHQDQIPTRQDAPVLGDKAQPSTPAATQIAIQRSAHRRWPTTNRIRQTLRSQNRRRHPLPSCVPAKPNQSTLPDSNTNVASTAGDPHPALDAKSNLEAASSPLERAARKREKQAPQPPKPANLDKPTPRVADASPPVQSPPIPRDSTSAAPSAANAAPNAKSDAKGALVANASAKPAAIAVPKRRPRMPMCGPSK